jgi:outer membrane protein assembly factor BamA
VVRSENRLIDQVRNEQIRPSDLYLPKYHAGLKLGYVFDNRDSKSLTTRGTFFRTELTALQAINENTRNLTRLTSELSFFLTFRLPARFTLANRVGTVLHFGHYEFYQAATLGGLENLRGFRRTRFAGQSSFYNNTELRLRLFGIPAYQSPIQVGALGFFDVGRVWLNGEDSRTWHQGYGGGLWLAPSRQIVLSAVYGFSREERLPLFSVGFFF